METRAEIRKRYEDALEAFVAKVRQDHHILAAILFGSLSYDEVWEKSDIDLSLIVDDEKFHGRSYCLVEDGINIHAMLVSRTKFKQSLEGSLQGGFMHSSLSRGRLLFSSDSSLEEYFRDAQRVGARDRDVQLMRAGSMVVYSLSKAEKWFHVKKDPDYTLLWLLYTVEHLAKIEVLTHGQVPMREAIHQAIRLNPEFLRQVYTDLIHQPKSEAALGAALGAVNAYLDEKVFDLFRPILDYLSEAGGVRSTTELNRHFEKAVQTESLSMAYEWLADREIVQKVSTPLRLTEKSRVAVQEAAYYYDHGDEQR